MSSSKQTPVSPTRVWNAPRLVRIGTIADVKANGTVVTQAPGNAKS